MASITEAFNTLRNNSSAVRVNYRKIDNEKKEWMTSNRDIGKSLNNSILRCDLISDDQIEEFEYKIISSETEKILNEGKISGINYFIVDINKYIDYFVVIKPVIRMLPKGHLEVYSKVTDENNTKSTEKFEDKRVNLKEIYKFIKAEPEPEPELPVFKPSNDYIPEKLKSLNIPIIYKSIPSQSPTPRPPIIPETTPVEPIIPPLLPLLPVDPVTSKVQLEYTRGNPKTENIKLEDVDGYDRNGLYESVIGDLEDTVMITKEETQAPLTKETMKEKTDERRETPDACWYGNNTEQEKSNEIINKNIENNIKNITEHKKREDIYNGIKKLNTEKLDKLIEEYLKKKIE